MKLISILFLLLFFVEWSTQWNEPSDDESDYVRELSCGQLYYKIFYMDEERDSLYVGSMDRVFRLNLQNISSSSCDRDVINLEPTRDDMLTCVAKGMDQDFNCRNHIRVILPRQNGNQLYICGTNAYSPKGYVIHSDLTHLSPSEYPVDLGRGIGKCPYDPLRNSTAIYIEKGNPGGLPALYTGTSTAFANEDSMIFRSDLYNTTKQLEHKFKRTHQFDSKWLEHNPSFVGSFDIGDHVYFFFREPAIEYMNCGKKVYSRVARLCKNDVGGKFSRADYWATFLKARLNCSIPGEFPFYFDEIQSVYQQPMDKTRFYATFTTSTSGFIYSAVCSFHINEVQAAFDGKFKEQSTWNSTWLPVANLLVPEPRPGSCVENTTNLPDAVLNFITSHPLMDKAVNHEHSHPAYYKKDLIFTKVVVDKIYIMNVEHTVYYVGTNLGDIYKIVQYYSDGKSISKLLDIIEVAEDEVIQVMEISQGRKSLYAATDNRIKQIDLDMCSQRYQHCFRCVSDPYCGWDRETNTCRPYKFGFLQDVPNQQSEICDSSMPRKYIAVKNGQTLHLSCFEKIPKVLRKKQISWYHHSEHMERYEIQYDSTKYFKTTSRALLLVSVNEYDSGIYEGYLGSTRICSYNIVVYEKQVG